MQIPKSRHEKLLVPDESPIYLTKNGFEKLKEKLAGLKRALPSLIEEAQRTAAYGDRSDNAEYKLAKGSLRRANWQILEIQEQIKRVVIIKPDLASGKVQIGSTVVLEQVGSASSPQGGKQKIFQILGPAETDPAKGRISFQSPLGAALMNHKKGDLIAIQIGSGSQKYRILEIK